MTPLEITETLAKRVALAQRPTPIHRLDHMSRWLGREVWVKRDDLTGLELSGNKVRKLEFLLADAVDKGADLLITCGGVQSNHARATALAGRRFGMKTWALLRGHSNLEVDGNLFLLRLCGSDVRWCTPDEYQRRDAIMSEMAASARASGAMPYIIPEGGSNARGALGYVAAMGEISQQIKEQGLEFDTLVCAVGSGGTLAGLNAGAALLDAPLNIIGFNVCDSAEHFEKVVRNIQAKLANDFGLVGADKRSPTLIDGYVGPGYAISGKGDLQMIREMAEREGLILDPAYTAKAFFGISDRIRQQDPRMGERILFLHSGGAFGLFPHRRSFF